MHARAATMSATRLVAGVPDPGEDRLGRSARRPGRPTSVSNAARSALAPPPRTTAMTSQSLRLRSGERPGDGRRRAGPLHGDRDVRDAEPEPRTRSAARGSRWQPSVPGLATSPTCSGTSGTGSAALRRSRPSASSVRSSCGPLRGHPPEQRGDVDLGQDEADLALGPVEVERAAQDHHHPLGELDALLGQRVPQGRPGAAPALHVQRGHAAPAPVAAGDRSSSGSTRLHVEVARAVVRDVLDLAADPEVPVAGKGPVQGALDLVVERRRWRGRPGGPRLVPGRRHGPVLRGGRRSGGASGSKSWRAPPDIDDTLPMRCPVTFTCPGVAQWQVTVSRPGGRGTGRSAGPCRGRSGLHRAGCWLTASRGDPQDSATESKPPMAGLRARTGKGETVR